MNKHDRVLYSFRAIADAFPECASVTSQKNDSAILIEKQLLVDVVKTIETWKSIAEEFANSLNITQGENKPKISVDIERFLAAQYLFRQEADDVQ